ncbi:MAG: glycosyltransferase [Clostridia bacterium]|nr:glycosyltransferase [Clostridia bacterium]
MRIKYLVHYDLENPVFKRRSCAPSAVTKASYIVSALNDLGYGVDIISPALPENGEKDRGGIYKFGENTVKYFSSPNRKNLFGKVIAKLTKKLGLLFYLVKNLRRGEPLVVYHSLYYTGLIAILKKLKKTEFILEVEEIYGDVLEDDKVVAKEQAVFAIADKFIPITALLGEKINPNHKPSVISHGTYKCAEKYEKLWTDDKIHVVYAGTFDPRKGGAFAAIGAAEHLSDTYRLHILGFGSESEIEAIKNEVERVNAFGGCVASYDGLLSGEAYLQFLQSCHIGLSTQNPNAKFNATSFPSKILSYMSNGLRVVSIRIPAITSSDVGDLVYYYDEQSAEEIAAAIASVNMRDEYDSMKVIAELDEKFKREMKTLINKEN